MDELFGLSMDIIMYVLVVLFAVFALAVGLMFLRGRAMFRMGIRNIGRRRAQTALVVAGLMLATIIITAAFTIGDTVDYGATNTTYNNLQRTDISLHHFQAAGQEATTEERYAPDDVAAKLSRQFASDPDIEGFIPFLFEVMPVLNQRTKLAEPAVMFAGISPSELDRFGGLTLTSGQEADIADLGEREVLVNTRARDKMDIREGDTITVYVQDREVQFRVAGVVREERASGALEFGTSTPLPGIVMSLPVLQGLTGRQGSVNNVSVVLRGGVRGTLDRIDPASDRLEAFFASPESRQQLGLGAAGAQVERIKKDAIHDSELAANVFTTLFLVLGLFSIASGVLLIFMIFVMLAAERRQEMGITRALGAERKHLVQAFVAEGVVYDLAAGLAGVALGVFFALFVVVAGARLLLGEAFDFLEGHVTVRSLVVSFCLGAVLTFITVVGSAFYVSRLNIVAAIRGQAESAERERGRRIRWPWLVASVPFLPLIPPLGIYMLLRKGIGISAGWTWLPVCLATGAGGLIYGRAIDSSFLFSLGFSLSALGLGLALFKFGAGARLTWTAVGAILLFYWLLPFNFSEALFGKFDNSGMEMFVLSGIMIVVAFALVIVYNARLLSTIYAGASRGRRGYGVAGAILGVTAILVLCGFLFAGAAAGIQDVFFVAAMIVGVAAAFSLLAQRFPGLAPALKMGIAYPLASRFRTGMTIAMFGLIIFSLVVMSVINASFLRIFTGDEARGSWDLVIETNRNNPVPDLAAALAEEGTVDPSVITAAGRMTAFDDDRQVVRQAGQEDWNDYVVRGADDAFWRTNESKLEARATGYTSDRAVFEAIRANPRFALIEGSALGANATGGFAPVFAVKDVEVTDGVFQPFEIEVRNEATGEVGTFTVVGATSNKIVTGLFGGLLINEQANQQLFGASDYPNIYVRLKPGTDSERTAKAIKAALVTRGVQAISIESALNDIIGTSRAFLRLMQAFMALGLVVGIAAIGVISLRSVVERRQQIGMLRAIGYERHTVALSFLFETAFVSLMGIGTGVLGGVLLSRNLMTSEDFTGIEGLTLFVPWPEVIVFAVIAFGFALLTTWLPSRQAAGVPIADSLRYE